MVVIFWAGCADVVGRRAVCHADCSGLAAGREYRSDMGDPGPAGYVQCNCSALWDIPLRVQSVQVIVCACEGACPWVCARVVVCFGVRSRELFGTCQGVRRDDETHHKSPHGDAGHLGTLLHVHRGRARAIVLHAIVVLSRLTLFVPCATPLPVAGQPRRGHHCVHVYL